MGKLRFAQVPERISTKSFVVLIIGNSKSNHLGAQGTFKDGAWLRWRGCRYSLQFRAARGSEAPSKMGMMAPLR